MKLPPMARIQQRFDTRTIPDIPKAVRSAMYRVGPQHLIGAGQSVAVTAGSRGIHDMDVILKALIDELKALGAKPFIVPAMGSHGGATAEGQKKVLEHYGITESTMGVSIRSAMDVIQVGEVLDGVPVFIDKNALEADHIVVVNRVKPHTDFEGDIESGLMKMMAIGLGKQHAADRYHNLFMKLGYHRLITAVAREAIERCPIAFGLAVVENQKDQTQIIDAMAAHEIEAGEKQLLLKAKALLPRIPFDTIDLLIVDEMGKNFSGTGMDQTVIARTSVAYHRVPDRPNITRIFVRDLSEHSGGNAIGIGNADFATTRLIDKIDRHSSYMNAITSSSPENIRIPPHFDTDREALTATLETIPENDPEQLRIVHIKNTLHLEEMAVSEALLNEAEENSALHIVEGPGVMGFDENGTVRYAF